MRRSRVEYVVIVVTVSEDSSTPCFHPYPDIPELCDVTVIYVHCLKWNDMVLHLA